jgi:hypothetical protein|tara:strand:- start:496 stop:684 length:189 start_codon:yes stop_codon:yes gene_type:complete
LPQDDDKVLKLRIERTEKTTEEDVKQFYIRVYKMAENLGFNVISKADNNQLIAFRGKQEDGE